MEITKWMFYLLIAGAVVGIVISILLVIEYRFYIKNFFLRRWYKLIGKGNPLKLATTEKSATQKDVEKTPTPSSPEKPEKSGSNRWLLAIVYSIVLILFILGIILLFGSEGGNVSPLLPKIDQFIFDYWWLILILFGVLFLGYKLFSDFSGLSSGSVTKFWDWLKGSWKWVLVGLALLLCFSWYLSREPELRPGYFQFKKGHEYGLVRKPCGWELPGYDAEDYCGKVIIVPADNSSFAKIRIENKYNPSVYLEGELDVSGELIHGSEKDDGSRGPYIIIPYQDFAGTIKIE